jgi:hypothetical protein
MAERKEWWEILRDQFASRGLLDPESERIQEAVSAAPAVKRQARGLLSLDPQAESDTVLEMGLGSLPGVGQAMALRDLERARRAKDPGAAAMAASNFIPFGTMLNRFRRGPMSELEQGGKVVGIRSRQTAKMADRINEAMGGGPQPLSDNVQREMKLATSVLQSKNLQTVESWIQAYYNADLPMEQFEAATSKLRKILPPETVDALIQNAGTFRTADQFKTFLNATPAERAKQLTKVSK